MTINMNSCVTNEKLISPFRGTYNTDDGHQVTLYAYLKAFRFTGSPALYLECDIHMCHNKCPVREWPHVKCEPWNNDTIHWTNSRKDVTGEIYPSDRLPTTQTRRMRMMNWIWIPPRETRHPRGQQQLAWKSLSSRRALVCSKHWKFAMSPRMRIQSEREAVSTE